MTEMCLKKPNKLSQTKLLKQIRKRCSSLGKDGCNSDYQYPNDVPKGHFVVYVGEKRSRYVVPIAYLRNPQFQILLQQAEDEYGFDQEMGLSIPCQEIVFRNLTCMLGNT